MRTRPQAQWGQEHALNTGDRHQPFFSMEMISNPEYELLPNLGHYLFINMSNKTLRTLVYLTQEMR